MMTEALPSQGNDHVSFDEDGEVSLSPMPPPPLRFSSYSLLEGGDLAAGSLGLPTGALFSPFAHLHPPPARIPRQPVLCTFCAAYPNPFCTVDPATGGWRCCFCGNDNPCYAEDFIGSSPAEHREHYPEMTYKTVEYSEPDVAGVLSGMSDFTLATGPFRRRDKAACAPAHVFVVDGNMREDALAHLARSAEKVMAESMDPEALVALVVFTGVVSVYRLGKAGVAVADVFPGQESTPPKELEALLTEGERDHFVPVRTGKDALCTILRLLRGVGDGTGRAKRGPSAAQGDARTGRAGDGVGGAARRRAWGARRTPVPQHRRKRCLGAAVEYALSLATTSQRPTSRVIVCLGGCPNFGPGAVAPCFPGAAAAELDPETLAVATEYFEALGMQSLEQGTGVDVFCGGNEAIGAAALHALVSPTGGYVVIQPSFSEKEFAANLSRSVGEQAMSHADGLRGCVIDVRASNGMTLLHVIGPAESTSRHDRVDREAEVTSMVAARTAEGRSAEVEPSGGDSQSSNGHAAKGSLGNTNHRLVVGRIDPRTTLALYYEGPSSKKERQDAGEAEMPEREGDVDRDDDDEEEYMVFQFVVRYCRSGEGRVTRVLTHRLPVRTDEDGYLQTVDPEAVAVLVGKEAVLRATYGSESGANREEVEEARVAVDTVVHEVSRHYRGFLQQRRQKGVSGARRGSRRRMNRESGAGVSGNDRNGGQDASPAGGTSLDSAEEGGAGGFPDEEEAFLGTGQYDPESGDLEPEEEGEEGASGLIIPMEEFEGPEAMVFPRELGWLPTQLFHLRRGPLLGPLLQNSDDPLCLRQLFLRGGLEDCVRMMAPNMFSLKAAPAAEAFSAATKESEGAKNEHVGGSQGAAAAEVAPGLSLERKGRLLLQFMEPVPVETLAMLADRILVLDTHDRIFVWSGSEVGGREFDALRDACLEVFLEESKNRFPSAPVVFFKDGSSWSRYLTSRLIPSHKDPVEEQRKSFPGLASLSDAELDQLKARFPQTDDESFREFFWDVCNSPLTAW